MTLALPAAPAPHPRRQLVVGTAVGIAAGTMLIGGMLAVWLVLRSRVVDLGERFPEEFVIPEVPSNVMLVTILTLCLFAQWTVHAAKSGDRVHIGISLGLVALLALAFVNAQAFIWVEMGMPVAEGQYASLFYSITGVMAALVVIGLGFTAVTAFRLLGGRLDERELTVSHAMYWYFCATAFCAVWFVVYVTK
jgi:heme/copper-type cytochrome/quinol oxidase subunit 3